MRDMVPMELDDIERAPLFVRAEATLDATPDAVFDELGDPSLWFPLMRRSVWRSGATSGVGAQREVDLIAFGAFRERMLAWDRGRRCAFTMTATTSPIVARMAEDWLLGETPDGRARLTWLVGGALTPVGRPLAPALKLVLRGMFATAARGLAKRSRWSAGRARGTHAV